MGVFTRWVAIFVIGKFIEIVLSKQNDLLIANTIDDKVDLLQKKSKEPGRELRGELIELFNLISAKLKENDGVN